MMFLFAFLIILIVVSLILIADLLNLFAVHRLLVPLIRLFARIGFLFAVSTTSTELFLPYSLLNKVHKKGTS
jgi:hypothetical protein